MADIDADFQIDVYLCKSLSKNLYLLQYPVRPSYMTYDNVDLLTAKIKPTQKKLEVEVALNTTSSHYAKSKGEQIALNVDGRTTEGTHFNSALMDKQVLCSSPATSDASRYTVGYLKQDELFLCPVHAQMQMKPSFEYLDKVDSRQKEEQAAAEGGDSSQDEAEDDAKPVQMKFSRPESDVAKARRLASYGYLQKKQEGERWIELQYHNIDSDKAESDRLRLIETRLGDKSTEFHVGPAEYLKMLVPAESQLASEKPEMPNNVLSLTQLKSMPLGDQVKALLTNAKVIRLPQLMTLLPHGTDPLATLRALQHVAVMVQGCWVVKSEVLYPKDGYSPHSGISTELLCRGRDFIMWRFTQSRCVTRKEINSFVKLPSEDIKAILEQMSKLKVNQGWEFVFEPDYELLDRYPEVAERQKMLWDAKYQTLSKLLNITEAQEKRIKEVAAAEASSEKPPRRRRNSARSRKRTLSGRSISDHSDIEPDPDLENMLKEPHRVLNGRTVELSSEPNTPDLEYCSPELKLELTSFIKEKLLGRLIFTLSELKRLVNVKLSTSPPGHIFTKGMSDKLLEQAINEVGAMSLNAAWTEEKIFICDKMGDSLDSLRQILVETLRTNQKVTRKGFVKAIEGRTDASENDIKAVMKDYLVPKNGWWYPKCFSEIS